MAEKVMVRVVVAVREILRRWEGGEGRRRRGGVKVSCCVHGRVRRGRWCWRKRRKKGKR